MHYSYEIMTDIPFLLGTMAFLAGYQAALLPRPGAKGRCQAGHWSVVGLVITVSTRPTMIGLVAVALAVTMWWSIRRRLPRAWGIAYIGIIVAIVLIFVWFDPRPGTVAGRSADVRRMGDRDVRRRPAGTNAFRGPRPDQRQIRRHAFRERPSACRSW